MSRWVEESGIEFRLRETKKKHNLVKHAQRHGRITAASHKPPSASPATCSFRNRQGLLAMDGPQTWQEVAVPKVKSKWMVNSTVAVKPWSTASLCVQRLSRQGLGSAVLSWTDTCSW